MPSRFKFLAFLFWIACSMPVYAASQKVVVSEYFTATW